MTVYPNGGSHTLLDSHRRVLEDGSAIAPDVLAESGARSIMRGAELPDVFSVRQKRRAPGVLFASHRPNGDTSWVFRPDKPRPDKPGHKYEQPCKQLGGAGNVLDILPSQRDLINDTSVPVIFVEGTKKMLSVVSAAREASVTVLVVAVIGCWNWMADGKPIADMLEIPLQGRRATVMYDSDMLRKAEVQHAARCLAEYLQERGADAFITYFEDAPDGSKVGADDFFAREPGGTFAELRMLTRRYRPEDFALVRLTRDKRLAAMISELVRGFWATEWKGQGGHTDRDTALMLIRAAAEHGRPAEGGVFVAKAWGDLQLEAKVGPRTISKAINRLQDIGLILERVKPDKPHKRGGFVLRAGVYQVGTERGTEQNVTDALQSLYAATIHPRTPRLMWSSPGSKPKRGTVEGTRKVRHSPPPKPKPAIRRPGKIRGAVLDALDAVERAGGTLTVAELSEALHRKRPRDLTRRKEPGSKGRDGLAIMLLDAGIVSLDGEEISLTADWLERLDEVREAGAEIEADELARRRMKLKRQAYHRRHEAPKSEPSAAGLRAVERSHEQRRAGLAAIAERAAAAAKSEELRKAEAFVRDRLRELGRIRLALLQDIWHDAGGDPWTIPPAVEALGCRVEELPEFDNRRFVFPPSEAEGVA